MMRSFYKINLSPQSVMSTKNVKLNNWVILSVFPINWEPGIIDLCNTLIILVIMINFHLLCSAALQRRVCSAAHAVNQHFSWLPK